MKLDSSLSLCLCSPHYSAECGACTIEYNTVTAFSKKQTVRVSARFGASRRETLKSHLTLPTLLPFFHKNSPFLFYTYEDKWQWPTLDGAPAWPNVGQGDHGKPRGSA